MDKLYFSPLYNNQTHGNNVNKRIAYLPRQIQLAASITNPNPPPLPIFIVRFMENKYNKAPKKKINITKNLPETGACCFKIPENKKLNKEYKSTNGKKHTLQKLKNLPVAIKEFPVSKNNTVTKQPATRNIKNISPCQIR